MNLLGSIQGPTTGIEARFGPLANEIIEEVYVNEVLEALEYCMGLSLKQSDNL